MGKKSHNNQDKHNHVGICESAMLTEKKRLSPLKRNEINKLVDNILKVSSGVPDSANAVKEWEAFEELSKLLLKVKCLERDLQVPMAPRSTAVSGFTSWLKEGGAVFDGMKIAEFSGYDFGIAAERDFKEGDLLMAVPRKLMLSVENVHQSLLGELAKKDPLLQHMSNVALALLVLLERHDKSSNWKPYIDILPTSYTTVLFFTPEEMKGLKGSPAFLMALRQCRFIARQYAYFNRLFQRENDEASLFFRNIFTFEEYCWAVSTVMTRQNTVVSSDGKSLTQALIPLWDMCNHTDGKLSTDFNVELNRSECRAWRPVSKGSQVFIFYGARPNCELLVHNGFVYPGSAFDVVRIPLGIARADPLFGEKAAVLRALSLPVSGDWDIRAGPNPISPRLGAFLRVFNMNKDELDSWSANPQVGDLMEEGCPLNSTLQDRIWKFLAMRIKLILAAYPTKREADEAQLSEVLTPCARLAVLLRLEEKRLLEAALAFVEDQDRSLALALALASL